MGTLRRFFARLGRFGSTSGGHEHPLLDVAGLERALGIRISSPRVFVEALSHRSYLQVTEGHETPSYERLEYLGDAVLSLVVGEYLFKTYPDAPEGDLTKIRSRLVNRKALGILAHRLRLGDFLLISLNAAQSGPKGMETILSDTFEAVAGAIYLDAGYDAAKEFLNRVIRNAMDDGIIHTGDENFKSQLLEQIQAQGIGAPRYVTTRQEGPDHDRTFTVEVQIGGVTYGAGSGKNKKDAEQAAAEQALQKFPNSMAIPPAPAED